MLSVSALEILYRRGYEKASFAVNTPAEIRGERLFVRGCRTAAQARSIRAVVLWRVDAYMSAAKATTQLQKIWGAPCSPGTRYETFTCCVWKLLQNTRQLAVARIGSLLPSCNHSSRSQKNSLWNCAVNRAHTHNGHIVTYAFLTNANSRSNKKLKSSNVKSTWLSKAAWTGPSGVGGWVDANVKPNSSILECESGRCEEAFKINSKAEYREGV